MVRLVRNPDILAGLVAVRPPGQLVVGFADEPRPLEEQMAGTESVWATLAGRHGLQEHDLDRVASWWHTDGDLGRDIECLTDMTRSRVAGFAGYRSTLDAFLALFDRLERERVVPVP